MHEQSIVVLTGAGISAESGIRTFRAADGLWEDHRIEDVATPEAFARNPLLVQRFYNERRRQLLDPTIQPNAAHRALAELESCWPGDFLLVTQNVDDLHERAGSDRLIHMHGELLKMRCLRSNEVFPVSDDITPERRCTCCNTAGTLRPHIVWFGEEPLRMTEIGRALERCTLFLSIGTSGNVYPAAGFVQAARRGGAHTVELNLEPSLGASHFAEKRRGRASLIVPAFVELLSGGHEPIPAAAAMEIAANVAGKLADKDRGMGFGQLDKSWKLVPPTAVTVKKRGQGYYIVEVFNLKEKRTLSVLMSEAGQVYDANFSGTFQGLAD